MEPTGNIEQFLIKANQLIAEGKEFSFVRQHLTESGADEMVINTIITQLKSQSHLKRRKRGFILGVLGSVILITGFLLTVLFYHTGISIHYVMYGMTSIGVILLMAGLVEVIGW